MIPLGGVAMVDGTSITDVALERKIAAAVRRDASVKIRITYDAKQRSRFEAVRALVTKAGATNVEVTAP